ncbi:MAG: transposase, partial [Oscillospiraceae bacterium]|nr:transposase [Oscillospiraceae bacterium]
DGSYAFLSKCSGGKDALDVFEWSTENGGNIAHYPYNAFACQLFTVTPVHPTVNDGLYSLRRTSDGVVTDTATLKHLSGTSYQYIGADGQAVAYDIRCNADGSYALTDATGLTESYVLSPVAQASVPAKLRGDVDANGKLEVADIVMMQKYLLQVGTLNDADMGDMDEDGVLDVFDLARMKRALLH